MKVSGEIKKGALDKATFAAGCFWGVEELFRTLPGVKTTQVGYTGGDFPKPTYEDVCSGTTGHAEAVEVLFDTLEISYKNLLEVFFDNHDPTSLNRQGADVGEQYRSAVFYHTEKQKEAAERMKEEIGRSGKYKWPLVTEILPVRTFWRAEEYHQQYIAKRGLSTCVPRG